LPKAEKESFVTEITPRSQDFSRWYLDVVRRAELADYSPVKGCMVIRPYGYAIWELIQQALDLRIKASGHVNAYFPLFIPESLLDKEAEHVEGFGPQVAYVTHGGGEELEEKLVVRPTSEAIIGTMYAKWVQSWRDLPILINQWAIVVRWGMTTRLIGAAIMVHGDDSGLVLPPRLAPYQVVIVPIGRDNWREIVLPKAQDIQDQLREAGIRVTLDEREERPGWKFAEWELRGVPLRLEIGPNDMENSAVLVARRDTREKQSLAMEGLPQQILQRLEEPQAHLLQRERQFRAERTPRA